MRLCGRRGRRNDPAAQLRMWREEAMVADVVNSRCRHQRGELRQQFVGRERQDEFAVARPLHMVEEATVLPHREPLQSQGRLERVAKEFLAPLMVVAMDAHSGVQGPAVEVGAATLVLDGVEEALAAIHLGSL